jgi:uncharacterized protein with PQ loop repeat
LKIKLATNQGYVNHDIKSRVDLCFISFFIAIVGIFIFLPQKINEFEQKTKNCKVLIITVELLLFLLSEINDFTRKKNIFIDI